MADHTYLLSGCPITQERPLGQSTVHSTALACSARSAEPPRALRRLTTLALHTTPFLPEHLGSNIQGSQQSTVHITHLRTPLLGVIKPISIYRRNVSPSASSPRHHQPPTTLTAPYNPATWRPPSPRLLPSTSATSAAQTRSGSAARTQGPNGHTAQPPQHHGGAAWPQSRRATTSEPSL